MDALLAGIGSKDRLNIEKHLAACDAEAAPAHGKLWRRIMLSLRRLAPLAVQTIGQHAVQLYVADGKYRMQVFALEDQRDGKIMIYMADVLDAAVKAGLLTRPPKSLEPSTEWPVAKGKGTVLRIEQLDAANTPNPAPHVKHMLGWNRKALRVTLLTAATPAQAEAAEALCALAMPKTAAAPVPAK
jgi:hypothetical protein